MKKYSRGDVIVFVIVAAIMLSATFWFIVTPPKVNPLCTTEYVNANGEEDCENDMKAKEQETEAFEESQIP